MYLREPREFEFLRTLVDGAHWNGQTTRQKWKEEGFNLKYTNLQKQTARGESKCIRNWIRRWTVSFK